MLFKGRENDSEFERGVEFAIVGPSVARNTGIAAHEMNVHSWYRPCLCRTGGKRSSNRGGERGR